MGVYTVKSKIVHGVTVDGFVIEDENGETRAKKTADVIKLARSEKISDAEAVLDSSTGVYVLSFNDSLQNLPTVRNTTDNMITILCRIVNSENKCVGYKVSDRHGKLYNLSLGKVWELALNEFVTGVRATVENNRKILRSVEPFRLGDIPVIEG